MKNKGAFKQITTIIVLLALIGCGTALLLCMKGFFIAEETKQLESLGIVYNNVYIRGEAVGGLTKAQALEKMDKYINEEYAADKKLYFRAPSSPYEVSFTYPQMGMGYQVERAVEEAYAFGRNEDGSPNRADIAELDVGGKYIDAIYSYSTDTLKACLASIEEDVNKELEPIGKTMDIDRTAEAAEELLRANEYDGRVFIATR